MEIYLLEVDYIDKDTGLLKTWYLSTGGDNFVTEPDDDPPNQFYEPDIKSVLNFKREILSDGVMGGLGSGGYGNTIVLNTMGKYDHMRSHGFGGQSVRLLHGYTDWRYADFVTVLTGTQATPIFAADTVELKVRDRVEELDKEIQTSLYLGNNVLPAGIEGNSDDIKGKPKPLCFGRVYGIEPPLVNTSKLVFQVHQGPVNDIDAVFGNAETITKGANYADSASLLAATITSGTYATCFAEGLFRINSGVDSSGTKGMVITANVKGDSSLTGYVTKPAEVFQRMLQYKGGFTAGDFNADDFAAVNAAVTYETGIFIDENNKTIKACANEFLEGFRIWGAFSRNGKISVGLFTKPTGLEAPAVTLTESEIKEDTLERLPAFDFGEGAPPYKVSLSFQKNYRVHSKTEIAGNVIVNFGTRASWVQEEWRTITQSDASVQNVHKLASVFEYSAYINDPTAASTEASKVLLLYKSELDRLRFDVDPDAVRTLDLGDLVNIVYPRFDCDNGRMFVLLAISEDNENKVVTLEVLG